jgi:hypothetical protein
MSVAVKRYSINCRISSPFACSPLQFAIIQCRLDYTNPLLYDTSEANIYKLWTLKSSELLARIVVNHAPASSASELYSLHWQPIPYWNALVTFKIPNLSQPSYLIFPVSFNTASLTRHFINLEHVPSLEAAPAVLLLRECRCVGLTSWRLWRCGLMPWPWSWSSEFRFGFGISGLVDITAEWPVKSVECCYVSWLFFKRAIFVHYSVGKKCD